MLEMPTFNGTPWGIGLGTVIETMSVPARSTFPWVATMNVPGLFAGKRLNVPRRTRGAPAGSKKTSNERAVADGLTTSTT